MVRKAMIKPNTALFARRIHIAIPIIYQSITKYAPFLAVLGAKGMETGD
jgi:hypothetical protein